MCVRIRETHRRASGLIGVAVLSAALIWPAGEASAQSFFDFLFGGARRPASSWSLPPQTQAYADPNGLTPGALPEPGSGRSATYCVRLCDGRYFPLQRNAASPAQLCKAFCPASATKVFSGSEIDHAVAADGARYGDLDNAFVYRQRLVAGCTCNGKDAFGLAPVDVSADPTLRPGDVVTTQNGLMAFTGAKARTRPAQTGEFTPIESYSAMSSDMRSRLATMSVAPAPPH